MKTIDRINKKFGKNSLELGIKNKKSEWKMKQDNVSSKFTTRWQDIIKVSAEQVYRMIKLIETNSRLK